MPWILFVGKCKTACTPITEAMCISVLDETHFMHSKLLISSQRDQSESEEFVCMCSERAHVDTQNDSDDERRDG